MPKPPDETILLETNQAALLSNAADAARSPLTPVTPVTTQGLASLQGVILNQDARSLDKDSRRSLQKHLQKFSKAVHLAISNSILQRDQIRFLMKINVEAKVRRLTRAQILGKAKVMGFNELEEARVKRAEKEAAQAAKGKAKRGKKAKGTGVGRPAAKVQRQSEAQTQGQVGSA